MLIASFHSMRVSDLPLRWCEQLVDSEIEPISTNTQIDM